MRVNGSTENRSQWRHIQAESPLVPSLLIVREVGFNCESDYQHRHRHTMNPNALWHPHIVAGCRLPTNRRREKYLSGKKSPKGIRVKCYADVDLAAGDCERACLPDIMRGGYGEILRNWKRKEEERGMQDDILQLEQARADADEWEQ